MFGGAGFGAEWFAGQAEGLVLETAPTVVIPGTKFGPGALPPPVPDVIRLPAYSLAGPGLDRRQRRPSRAGVVRIGQGQLWLTSGAVRVSTPPQAVVPALLHQPAPVAVAEPDMAVHLFLQASVPLHLTSAPVRALAIDDADDQTVMMWVLGHLSS